MAKIPELPAAGPIQPDDLAVIWQAGKTRQVPAAALGAGAPPNWDNIGNKPAVIAAGADKVAARAAIDAVASDDARLSDARTPTAAGVAATVHAATAKTTPADADEIGYVDSAAGWGLVKLTWANLKAVLLAYFRGQFREKLTAPRTYYVRADGNDVNNGLSNTATGAFRSIQKAVDTTAALDLGIYDVTISVGAGTWIGSTTLKPLVGAGRCVIRGANADMSSTVVHTTGDSCFSGYFTGRYRLEWLRLQTTTSGYCIRVIGGGAVVEWANVDFGPCATSHVISTSNARAESAGAYTISGGGYAHVAAYDSAVIQLGAHAVTLAGTPAFSGAFVVADRVSSVIAVGLSISGSTTGPRYRATLNGAIITLGGENFFPGSAPGVKESGGQYA